MHINRLSLEHSRPFQHWTNDLLIPSERSQLRHCFDFSSEKIYNFKLTVVLRPILFLGH